MGILWFKPKNHLAQVYKSRWSPDENYTSGPGPLNWSKSRFWALGLSLLRVVEWTGNISILRPKKEKKRKEKKKEKVKKKKSDKIVCFRAH